VRSGAWWRVHGVYVGGRTRENSHPAFVAVAPESFYDGNDEFAPFGNDHGSDILGALEDWYTTGGQDDDVPQFLIDTLAGYGYPPSAHLWSADSDTARAWARAAGDDDYFVQATAQTALGVAVGQFKIRGHVTSAVRRIGWQAVTLQRADLEDASTRYPHWAHADAAAEGIGDVVRVLSVAPSAPARG
jgi:uncharacterized protein YfeS